MIVIPFKSITVIDINGQYDLCKGSYAQPAASRGRPNSRVTSRHDHKRANSTYSNSSTLAKPMNRRPSFFLVTMTVSCVIAFVAWKAFEPSSSAGTAPARQSIMTVGQPAAEPSASGAAKSSVAPPAEKSLRDRFREAKDYARFVAEIAPLASTGNPEAEYLMAKSLKWCAQISRLYFVKPNSEVRTLEEVQAIAAARPVGLSQEEIVMIYTRCRGFLEDPEMLKNVPYLESVVRQSGRRGISGCDRATGVTLRVSTIAGVS